MGIAMIVASVVIMSRVADAEERSPIFWSALTFALCLVCSKCLPFPFINIAIGLALSFGTMFALKLMHD